MLSKKKVLNLINSNLLSNFVKNMSVNMQLTNGKNILKKIITKKKIYKIFLLIL